MYKIIKIWESGAEFIYLGIWWPKHKNQHTFSLQQYWSYKQENVFKKGTKFGSLTSKKIRDFTFWPKIGHKFTFENAVNVNFLPNFPVDRNLTTTLFAKVDMDIIDTFWFISVNFHNIVIKVHLLKNQKMRKSGHIYCNYKRKPYIISLQLNSMVPILHRIWRKNSILPVLCYICKYICNNIYK